MDDCKTFQISSTVGLKGAIIEVNAMFMYSINSVLWRIVTGKTINPSTGLRLTSVIRYLMQVSERSKLTDVLQARTHYFSRDFSFDRFPPKISFGAW